MALIPCFNEQYSYFTIRFLLQRQWPTRAKSVGRTSHLVSTYEHADLRVRTFGLVSAHSRACECALSGLRVRTL